MFKNKHSRVVGSLAALTTSVALAVTAQPAHALTPFDPIADQTCAKFPGNLVVNCGFESGPQGLTAPGWTHLVAVASDSSGVVENEPITPHSGSKELIFGSESGDDVWTQTLHVKPHTQYVIGASVWITEGAANTPQDSFVIGATDVAGESSTVIYQSKNATLIGWHQIGGIVTTGSSTTMALTLSGDNGPGETYVDDVFVAAQLAGCAAVANNLVKNCGFESSTVPWVASGTGHDSGLSGNAAYGGTGSLFFGDTAPNESTWSQTFTVRPHTEYALSYMDEFWSEGKSPVNNLSMSVVPAGGSAITVATSNVADQSWKATNKTFTTGSGTSATISFSGDNTPGYDYVDDVVITAVPHLKISAKGRSVTTLLTGVGGQKVELQRFVHKHWRTLHTWTAPKSGWSKSWTLHVAPGRIRATSLTASGYNSVTSNAITVK